MANLPTPKPWILGIHAYVPGKATSSDGRALIKLSANENPLGTSPAALEALEAAREEAATYPDPGSRELRRQIGEVHGLDPERIVCGTGSDELLNLAAQGFAGPGDEVLFSRYSFSVYDIAARRCGAVPIEAEDNHFTADVGAMLASVTDRTRVVFLANPNNPTGTFIDRSKVAALHAGLPKDVLLVIDQAYAEYLLPEQDDGGLALAAQHENVLVSRTFSKIYGLAAERIGWATGAPHLIDTLNRIRGPFNVTASGQAAAIAALQDRGFVERSADHNRVERACFVDKIAMLGNHKITAVPSEANFVLLHFNGALSAEAALNGLAEAGYAVRHLPGQGLPMHLRITVGKREDMNRIAATISELAESVA
ncbi:MAG: histidinol-phosphate transaminase [Pseudomonadota bacterium]